MTVQNLNFVFDVLGNLQSKTDVRRNLSETYGYDSLNRLISVSGSSSLTMTYDGLGNVASKSDVGTYVYNSSRPHAMASAGSASYVYDSNGNLTSGDGRSNAYTVFNKPYSMAQGSQSVSVDYGPNRERFHRIDVNAGATTTTYYVGTFERITRPNGVVEMKRYLDGEVIVTKRSDGTQSTEYPFTDQTGSLDVVTNDSGAIVQSTAFDGYGWRRDPNTDVVLPANSVTAFDTTHTTRGYTSHEELDTVTLVHMNGRVYEPKRGRFLSPDPFVQEPSDTQSLNRFSYTINNPTTYTDPTGYYVDGGVSAFVVATIVASIIRAVEERVLQSTANASGPGGVPTSSTNGAPSSNGRIQTPCSGPLTTFTVTGVCAVGTGAGDDSIGAASDGGTSSRQTNGNFENGAGTWSWVRTAGDVGFRVLVPGADLVKCTVAGNCTRSEVIYGTLEIAAAVVLPEVGAAAVKAVRVWRAGRELEAAEKITQDLVVDRTVAIDSGSRVGYHATRAENVESILRGGFRESQEGRLGGGGVYVNNTTEGAMAEYFARYPGAPPPAILRVEYIEGLNYRFVPPPSFSTSGALPLAADTLTAESIRPPGTFNTLIRNGTAIPSE